MERNIPHVLDVFSCSPRARRRVHATDIDKIAVQMKDADMGQKNPGSDSAVSVDSSDDETNITKYFDYLNDDDQGNGSASKRKKKKKNSPKDSPGKENIGKENNAKDKENNAKGKENNAKSKENAKNKEQNGREQASEHNSRKTEYEKDMRHIERHLSMKKTIRKKMMRDLQQAFVEDPGEFQQDPSRMAPEKKNNIDIRNLTFSKGRLSKSEHNFLDMLKDEAAEKEKKERKGFMGFNNNKNKAASKDNLKDDDSGHGSPSREPPTKAKSKPDIREGKEAPKEEKKVGFWKKLTGKGKSKR